MLATPHTLHTLRRYGLLVIVGSVAGLGVHFGLVGVDALLVEEPVLLDFESRFWRSAFSFPFLPILLMEMVLTTLTLALWMRMRAALRRAHESDMQRQQYEATVRALQRIVALLAEHLGRENTRILQELAARRQRGRAGVEKIEAASRRISEILQALSETGFVTPYVEGAEKSGPVDLLQELARRIDAQSDRGA